MDLHPLLIGIAGGSTSGKTTLTARLKDQLADRASYLSYDEYYAPFRQRQDLTLDEEGPEVYRNSDFMNDLIQLKSGQSIKLKTNSREMKAKGLSERRVEQRPILLVEGYLIFHNPEVRRLFDMKIFIDITEDEMVRRRRLRRKAVQQSRFDTDTYIQHTMLPGYRTYVLPQIAYADTVLNGELPLDVLTNQIYAEFEKKFGADLKTL
jgi:uridine kinase